MVIAEIIVDIANKQVNRSFDYIIPPHLEKIVSVGYRVYVPFGNTKRVGFVVGVKDITDFKSKLKEIIDVMDVYPVLSEEFIELAKYIAENNFSFYATTLQTMIPTALKIKYQKVAKVVDFNKLSDEAKRIFTKKELIIDGFDNTKLNVVYEEVALGNIILDTKLKKRKDSNIVNYLKLNDSINEPTSKQGKDVVRYLEEINDIIEMDILLDDLGYSKNVINTLVKNNIVSIVKKEVIPNQHLPKDYELKKIIFNDYQSKVYKSVDFNKHKTYLLHGVTGSGKTEVYMRWIDDVIASNKSAIMLVPEISLTPQITNLFLKRFGTNIAILHSRLTPVEKYNEWKKIINKQVNIVVGARSAIFAPLYNLGIVIIDECHESSYIQQNNPKYNAIEIAKIRASNYNCPLILGSATPDVCDYYYATNGEYELLNLPVRANNKKLPQAEVVDMREELMKGNKSVFSYSLQRELVECYKRKEQAILFLNRRGFSSFVMCRSCGEAVKCPHCDVSLTYHASTQTLKCHYCGHSIPNVNKCFNCGSDKIRFVGSGTEKIMDAVSNLIPEAKVLRVDVDTTSKIEDYENAFYKFKNNEADILVGTQMITKGLDFDNVTLVGVVNADLALNYPIYDASMVAYNLIEQVSGRAGRAQKDGKVIIQTYNPNHYVIECAKTHDYDGFYKFEIENRRITQMPPFSSVIEIKVSSKDAKIAYEEAQIISRGIKSASKNSIILGPTEAMIFKKNDIYNFIIQIQAVEDSVLEKVRYIYPLYQNKKDVTISITRMG